jgi:N6-L-threonylcarbamoyladenine synthase
MKILAIETSCDETSCAVVENGRRVLANVISSQIDLHAKTGGVVPEVAAREHVLKMIPVLEETLEVSGCGWEDIDAVAVTQGPGLVSSLIIGTETANVISYVKGLPLITVQHIVGHIYSNWLVGEGRGDVEPKFPLLILTVSGGHNDLILMKDHFKFEVLGETRDDAAGEAFDKVAKILGLGYPGGPAISKIAVEGDENAFKLPKIYLDKDSFDFSFSGLKTAVFYEVKNFIKKHGIKDEYGIPHKFKADLAASFQKTAVEVLSDKLIAAAAKYPVKEIHLAGGVSANRKLRQVCAEKITKIFPKIKFRFPATIPFCTDNAAMIAAAAYYSFKKFPTKFKPKSNIIPATSFNLF